MVTFTTCITARCLSKMFSKNMWNLILVSLVIGHSVHAVTEEEIKMKLTKLVMECNKNGEVSVEEMMKLQSFITPVKTETKCVLACAYKASGIMTDNGLYDLDHAYKIAEELKNGDEKRLTNGKKMADVCVKVNDVKVSDGDKGCERAALIFKCTVDNAPKFGFKL